MPYLIGTDEAGYGPNLGPLVVATTVWHVDGAESCDLYDRLTSAVARTAREAATDGRLAIADSKQLYQSGSGLENLERGVLAALRVLRRLPSNFIELLADVAPQCAAECFATPWHDRGNEMIPVAVDQTELIEGSKRLKKILVRENVRLVSVRAAVIQPREFNELVERHGGKGAALSNVTLDLLASAMAELDKQPALITCDKHGGRNRYGELLNGRFGDDLVEVRRESREESVYRWGPTERRVEIRFRAGGEEFLPAALASMTAKYLRELSMRAFNRFWQRDNPELRPTAGYPVDAARFRREIAEAQQRLGIADRVLWRTR